MNDIAVIGCGAGGMLAAIAAAGMGANVTVFEKNEKAGKKIFITGKGRCNLTNESDISNHLANVMSNPKFMYAAYNMFGPYDIINLINEQGISTKTERGNRVFPQSDKSSDVIKALVKAMTSLGVKVVYNCEIKEVIKKGDKFEINSSKKSEGLFDSCIVATGGISYPQTGSTGDGYDIAKKFSHTVTKLSPSLVPVVSSSECCKDMQGLSLKNVSLKVCDRNGKEIFKDTGEMIFTHFGISGPLVLSLSALLSGKDISGYTAVIDFKPAMTKEMLDKRILRDFEENKNKDFVNSLGALLPKKAIDSVIQRSGINERIKVNEITKEMRESLVNAIKEFKINITGLRGFSEAIITRGGVNVKEINPSTMESKLCEGLYFAGEVLDVDALTGGYNLQIAWSSGYLAGYSAIMKLYES